MDGCPPYTAFHWPDPVYQQLHHCTSRTISLTHHPGSSTPSVPGQSLDAHNKHATLHPSLNHSLTHSLTHRPGSSTPSVFRESPARPCLPTTATPLHIPHSLTHSLTHTLTHSPSWFFHSQCSPRVTLRPCIPTATTPLYISHSLTHSLTVQVPPLQVLTTCHPSDPVYLHSHTTLHPSLTHSLTILVLPFPLLTTQARPCIQATTPLHISHSLTHSFTHSLSRSLHSKCSPRVIRHIPYTYTATPLYIPNSLTHSLTMLVLPLPLLTTQARPCMPATTTPLYISHSLTHSPSWFFHSHCSPHRPDPVYQQQLHHSTSLTHSLTPLIHSLTVLVPPLQVLTTCHPTDPVYLHSHTTLHPSLTHSPSWFFHSQYSPHRPDPVYQQLHHSTSFTHSLTHPPTHPPTHSLTHSLAHSLTHRPGPSTPSAHHVSPVRSCIPT